MTALENLLVNYNCKFDQNSTLHSIVRIILQHLNQASKMTIDELAQFCFTSPSTISRMVKSLGYRNFSTFQTNLSDCLSEYNFHNLLVPTPNQATLAEKICCLVNTEVNLITQVGSRLDTDALTTFATALHHAENVSIFSYAEMLMELSLQTDLMYNGICCDILLDANSQLDCVKQLPKGTVSLIIAPYCLNGTSHTTRLAELAQRNGNKICLITSSDSIRHIRNADYAFTFEGKGAICDQFAIQTILAAIALTYRSLFL